MEAIELLKRLKNDLDYSPQEVIAAIDEICERHGEWSRTQWHIFSEALLELKWSGHYAYAVTPKELSSNPGFYADLVLWAGWKEAKRARDEGAFDDVTRKQLAKDRGR